MDKFDEMARECIKFEGATDGEGPSTFDRFDTERAIATALRAAATVPPNMVRVGVEDRKMVMMGPCGQWPSDEMLATDVKGTTVMWVAPAESAARAAKGGGNGQ